MLFNSRMTFTSHYEEVLMRITIRIKMYLGTPKNLNYYFLKLSLLLFSISVSAPNHFKIHLKFLDGCFLRVYVFLLLDAIVKFPFKGKKVFCVLDNIKIIYEGILLYIY